MKSTIIGLGQPHRGDDAVGLAIAEAWRRGHGDEHPEVELQLLHSPGLSLLAALEWFDRAILIDAVQSGAEAGSLHELTELDLQAFGEGSESAHGWGVAETLQLGRILPDTRLPALIHVLAVEAAIVAVGAPLSAACRRSIPQAVGRIEAILSRTQVPTKERV